MIMSTSTLATEMDSGSHRREACGGHLQPALAAMQPLVQALWPPFSARHQLYPIHTGHDRHRDPGARHASPARSGR